MEKYVHQRDISTGLPHVASLRNIAQCINCGEFTWPLIDKLLIFLQKHQVREVEREFLRLI